MDPGAKVRHQVAKRPGLPSLIKGLERFRDAVRGWGDLVGIDSVQLLAVLGTRKGRIPKNQGPSTDEALVHIRYPILIRCRQAANLNVWPEGCTTDRVHFWPILARYTGLI